MKTKFGNISLNEGKYYRVTSRKEGNFGKMFHKLVWEDFYGCEVPKGFIIHHKNGDTKDNCILNLQLMRKSDHSILHNKSRKISLESKLKISKNYNSTGYFRVSNYIMKYNGETLLRYTYTDDNNKQQAIYSHTIEELERKVLEKGLPWRKLNG